MVVLYPANMANRLIKAQSPTMIKNSTLRWGGGGGEGGTMDIKLCKLTYSYINSILIHLNLFVAIMNDQHRNIRTWTILLKKL